MSPAPAQSLGGNFFDELTAAEGDNRILVSRRPSFGVTVDERHVARSADGINAALEKPLIFVLAIDDAGGSILLDESDGKELSFGFCDQVVEFGLHGWSHWFGFYWFGFWFGKAVFGDEHVDCQADHAESDGDDRAEEEEGKDVRGGGVLHWLVGWLVTGRA